MCIVSLRHPWLRIAARHRQYCCRFTEVRWTGSGSCIGRVAVHLPTHVLYERVWPYPPPRINREIICREVFPSLTQNCSIYIVRCLSLLFSISSFLGTTLIITHFTVTLPLRSEAIYISCCSSNTCCSCCWLPTYCCRSIYPYPTRPDQYDLPILIQLSTERRTSCSALEQSRRNINDPRTGNVFQSQQMSQQANLY